MDMFGSLIKSPGIKISSFIDSNDDNIDAEVTDNIPIPDIDL